ncbi:putative ferredoxin-like protein [Oceanisphaera litoralis]|uniref:hypothetical protein n=1 Tax=Oceanisphaera litoralis TaxID=225144 RepID=UPI00195BEC17|nr:hypothetical protein [Oceanisphaera litoralis]MBM7454495.1 putative ferredoxin-like protein [Oceanisphaera litoralis]
MSTLEERYLQKLGLHCPACGHDDIQGASMQSDAGSVWQEMYCPACEVEWVDLYHLSGIVGCDGFNPGDPA